MPRQRNLNFDKNLNSEKLKFVYFDANIFYLILFQVLIFPFQLPRNKRSTDVLK